MKFKDKMLHLKAPDKRVYNLPTDKTKIFLAGTIDMGNSEDWQQAVADRFKDRDDLVFLNPRREGWSDGPEWIQDISNPIFKEQVTWELDGLDAADYIIMNLLKDSKSVISLLEFGLHARSRKMVVVCPEGFYRRGNIQIVAERFGIPVLETLDEALKLINL